MFQAMHGFPWVEAPQEDLDADILALCSQVHEDLKLDDSIQHTTNTKPRFKTPNPTSKDSKLPKPAAPVKVNPLQLHKRSELAHTVRHRLETDSAAAAQGDSSKLFEEILVDSEEEADQRKELKGKGKILSKLVTGTHKAVPKVPSTPGIKSSGIRIWNDNMKTPRNSRKMGFGDSEDTGKLPTSKSVQRSTARSRVKPALMSPVRESSSVSNSLFKSVVKRNAASENIFEFGVSDPDTPPSSVRKQKQRSTMGLKSSSRGKRQRDIEREREQNEKEIEREISVERDEKEGDLNLDRIADQSRAILDSSGNDFLIPKITHRTKEEIAMLEPKPTDVLKPKRRPRTVKSASNTKQSGLKSPEDSTAGDEQNTLKPKKTSRKAKPASETTKPTRTRLTRAKTKTVEEQREAVVASDDAFSLSFEQVAEEEDQESDLCLLHSCVEVETFDDSSRSENSTSLPDELMIPSSEMLPPCEVPRTENATKWGDIEVDECTSDELLESSPDARYKAGLCSASSSSQVTSDIEIRQSDSSQEESGTSSLSRVSCPQNLDTIEEVSDIEVRRGDSDEENIQPKRRTRGKRGEKEKPRMSTLQKSAAKKRSPVKKDVTLRNDTPTVGAGGTNGIKNWSKLLPYDLSVQLNP